jgi:hypothetical protein
MASELSDSGPKKKQKQRLSEARKQLLAAVREQVEEDK